MPEADWFEKLNDQMASRETRTARRSIAINYPNELYVHVLAAAKARGMSMTAYQRRASLAFAEHDTGFDWLSEMSAEPPICSFVKPGAGVKSDGVGFGYWRIVNLADHAEGLLDE